MEKKLSKLNCLLLLCTLAFFVLPPIFVSRQETDFLFAWNFPYAQIIRVFYAALLLYFAPKNQHGSSQQTTFLIKKRLLSIVIVFILLFVCAFAINLVGNAMHIEAMQTVTLPSNLYEYLWCFITYYAAAFYEEAVYRYYLPKCFTQFFSNRAGIIFCEILCVLLFTFAHRYLGLLSLINACLAGIVLRVCCKKNNSIVPCFVAHGTYNLVMLFLFAEQ